MADSDKHICPKCGTEMEHKVDTENSSCPDEYYKCPKCGEVI